MSVTVEYKTQFARDGFVVAERLFTRDEMEAAKQEVRRVLEEVRVERAAKGNLPAKESGVYVGLSIRSPFFRALNADARLVDILSDVVGPNLEFWSDKVVYKSAGVDFGSPWHQDYSYWEGAHKFSIWIAMDDATRENGCLKVIPGSHTSIANHGGKDEEGVGFINRLRPEDVDEAKVLDLPAPAGTAVFFHDLLQHASYRNTSGQDRWALIPTYRDASQDDLAYDFAKAAFMIRGERTGKVVGSCKPEFTPKA